MPISEYLRSLRAKIGHDMIFMPAITAVVFNEHGEILLQRAKDDGQWYLIGGSIDPGEEPADAVVREVWEETGVRVIPDRIVGVYGGQDFIIRYSNGDQVAVLSVTFACRAVGGEPQVNDDESLEVRYFAPDSLPELEPRHRLRIEDALDNNPQAKFVFKPMGKTQ
jgi:8-oxo-dGTP diphosphatase